MASYFLDQLSRMDPSTLSSHLPSSLAGLVPYILTALTLYFSLLSLLNTGRFFLSITRFFVKWGALAALGLSAWATWNGEGDKVLSTASQFGRGAVGLGKWGWDYLDGSDRVGSLWGRQTEGRASGGARTRSQSSGGKRARGAKKSGWDLEDIVSGVTGENSEDVLGYVQNIAKTYLGDDSTARATNSKKQRSAKDNKNAKGPLEALGVDPLGWAGKLAFGQAKQAWDTFADALGDAANGPKAGKGNTRHR